MNERFNGVILGICGKGGKLRFDQHLHFRYYLKCDFVRKLSLEFIDILFIAGMNSI